MANFGSYDKTYGTLAGVVAFLVWVWITNVALLLGAELNAERERTLELREGVAGAHKEIQLEPRSEPKPTRPRPAEHPRYRKLSRTSSVVGCDWQVSTTPAAISSGSSA